MKKTIFAFFCYFTYSCAFAQNSFITLIPNDCDCTNAIIKMLDIDNNHHLAIHSLTSTLNFDRAKTEAIIINNEGKIVSRSRIDQENSDYTYYIEDIILHDGYYYTIGKMEDEINGRFYIRIQKLDAFFRVIRKNDILIDKQDVTDVFYTRLLPDKDSLFFVFTAEISQGPYSNIGVIDTALNTPHILNDIFQDIGFELSFSTDKKQLILDHSDVVYVFNRQFDVIKSNPSIYSFEVRRPYKNKYIGISRKWKDATGKPERDMGVHFTDINNTILKTTVIGRPKDKKNNIDTVEIPSPLGLDWKDENKIFASAISFDAFNFALPIYSQSTKLLLAQLDSTLAPKWIKYWGTGSTIPIGLLATNDGGVIVYGGRDTLQQNQTDAAFIIKFNENGILSTTDSNNDNPLPNIPISIGANPFHNAFNLGIIIDEQYTNRITCDLYDVNGKLLKKTLLFNGINTLDCSSLPNAMYFYQVKIDNKYNIKTGKIIKQE